MPPHHPFDQPAPSETIGMAWFSRLATRLLHDTALVINQRPHRIEEVEFYYNGPGHEDPFTHDDAHQATPRRWYFHRKGGSYSGGSFKGVDISFGPKEARGGILIRTIRTPENHQLNGCSLCVDYMLDQTQHEHVAALDAEVMDQDVWDDALPLHLRTHEWPDASTLPILQTARVGLTLKRAAQHPTMPDFFMRPYRFLTDYTIPKGKLHTIIALYQRGDDVAQIRQQTRSTVKHIERLIRHYEQGRRHSDDIGAWFGQALTSAQLAKIHGLLAQRSSG